MVVGIPGVGIGGLFYLLSALWMPIHAWRVRRRTGEPADSALVRRQVAISLGIVAGIWVTGWLLGLVLVPETVPVPAGDPGQTVGTVRNVWRVSMLFTALFTLGAVLAGVQIMVRVVRPGTLDSGPESGRLPAGHGSHPADAVRTGINDEVRP